ncbi:MAG: hypothetical protein WA240_06290 [Nitrospirota bacterium]
MNYFNKKSFTMRQVVGLLTIVFLGIAVIAYAVTIPNTFNNGDPISSSQMNLNFTAVKNAIDVLEAPKSVTYAAVGFSPSDETISYTKQLNGYVSGQGTFIIPLILPAGAIITGIESRAHDGVNPGNLNISLRWGTFPGSETLIAGLTTTDADVPGTITLSNLALNHTIAAGPNAFYWIDVTNSLTNGNLGFFSVTVHYSR